MAAGRGSRFGGPLPKQYAVWEGQPVLRHTIMALRASLAIADIRVVISREDEAHYKTATAGLGLAPPVAGGVSRQQSVLHGLEGLAADAPDFVAIHDAARPFVRADDIAACLAAASRAGIDGAILGIPLADTLKRVDGDGRCCRDGAAHKPVARPDTTDLPLRPAACRPSRRRVAGRQRGVGPYRRRVRWPSARD